MEDPGADVAKIFEQREREFLLAPVRVTMKTSTDEIEVGDLLLKKSNEGERLELPRWVAEELVEIGLWDVLPLGDLGALHRPLTKVMSKLHQSSNPVITLHRYFHVISKPGEPGTPLKGL